jgi:hypothetical protein
MPVRPLCDTRSAEASASATATAGAEVEGTPQSNGDVRAQRVTIEN